MVLKRAVILKIYYMANGLASIIHKKIYQIFKDVGERWKNDLRKILVIFFKQQSSKLKKGYSQVLVKQTVATYLTIWDLSLHTYPDTSWELFAIDYG